MQRILTLVLAASLLVIGSTGGVARSSAGAWEETRFRTGCDPGPAHAAPPPEHHERRYPSLETSAEPVALQVDLDSFGSEPILGSGFNFEHALWSCPEFRSIFGPEILDPFKPSIARVDTGLLPAAPAELQAEDLGPAVYQSVLSSAPYAESWRFFQRLNRA